MNKVIFCGRTTKDAEIRTTNEGLAIARFTMAIDRPKKKNGEDNGADFINCLAFGKTAELIEKYVLKGRKILVEGRWQTGSYENNEKKKVYTNECVIDKLEFVEKADSTPAPAPSDVGDGFMNIPDSVGDELPFV